MIENDQFTLICDDNITYLKTLAENSVDSCITDPPYGMNIAGVGWDKNVPPVDTWKEVYRVLKPGSFVLSFCSPEFYHRMAVNVEDAGFKPIDMLFWIVTTKMAKVNRLKPAHEPIFVAQKPYEGSIQKNFDKWGTGKINIEQARVKWEGDPPKGWIKGGSKRRGFGGEVAKASDLVEKQLVDANPNGRYPSNIIGHFDDPEHQKYFYAPRVSRKERGEYNDHPTPKPIDLMKYLCEIYSPIGGVVLDPFLGSGSTGIAAVLSKRRFIGIDISQHYVDISLKRINDHTQNPTQLLFEEEE